MTEEWQGLNKFFSSLDEFSNDFGSLLACWGIGKQKHTNMMIFIIGQVIESVPYPM